jgi:hypothetical protein
LFGKFLDLEAYTVILQNVTECTMFRCTSADNLDISVTESIGGAIASITGAVQVNVVNFTACEAHYGSALLILLREQSSRVSNLLGLLVVGCKQKTGIDIAGPLVSSIRRTICYNNSLSAGVIYTRSTAILLDECDFFDNSEDLGPMDMWDYFHIRVCRFEVDRSHYNGYPLDDYLGNSWGVEFTAVQVNLSERAECVAGRLTSFFTKSDVLPLSASFLQTADVLPVSASFLQTADMLPSLAFGASHFSQSADWVSSAAFLSASRTAFHSKLFNDSLAQIASAPLLAYVVSPHLIVPSIVLFSTTRQMWIAIVVPITVVLVVAAVVIGFLIGRRKPESIPPLPTETVTVRVGDAHSDDIECESDHL